ncbi:hypothetical protein [Streptomyces sp. NBC_01497]|uniref:hypothetical protein n=1 Tax=Streptomyces sp. NBC_01497 TaxID=2903885 RepID=UPI002E357BCD|nr:hypothetical protein [Streptomyces sp. NBC_01497]
MKRAHRERSVIAGQEHDLALGIWHSNTKTRRDELTPEQPHALREFGIEWA